MMHQLDRKTVADRTRCRKRVAIRGDVVLSLPGCSGGVGGGGSVWNSSNRDLAGWLASENDGLTVYELLTGGTASQYWVGGEKSLWPLVGTILTTIRYRNRMEQMQTLAQQNDRRLTGVSVGFWSDTSGRPVVMYSVWENCMHDGQLKVCVVTFN